MIKYPINIVIDNSKQNMIVVQNYCADNRQHRIYLKTAEGTRFYKRVMNAANILQNFCFGY